MSSLVITPKTRVGELLDAYPEAEEVLISIAPKFAALRNPVLRRTVAKVATLQQAARVGEMSVSDLVFALRDRLGLEIGSVDDSAVLEPGERPEWVDAVAPSATIDAGALLDAGDSPIGVVSKSLSDLNSGSVVQIDAPFEPAPLIDSLRAKGHIVFSESDGNGWKVWIRRV